MTVALVDDRQTPQSSAERLYTGCSFQCFPVLTHLLNNACCDDVLSGGAGLKSEGVVRVMCCHEAAQVGMVVSGPQNSADPCVLLFAVFPVHQHRDSSILLSIAHRKKGG